MTVVRATVLLAHVWVVGIRTVSLFDNLLQRLGSAYEEEESGTDCQESHATDYYANDGTSGQAMTATMTSPVRRWRCSR